MRGRETSRHLSQSAEKTASCKRQEKRTWKGEKGREVPPLATFFPGLPRRVDGLTMTRVPFLWTLKPELRTAFPPSPRSNPQKTLTFRVIGVRVGMEALREPTAASPQKGPPRGDLQGGGQVPARNPVQDEQGDQHRQDQDRRIGGGGAEIPAADPLEDLDGHCSPGTVVQNDRAA